MELKNEIKSYTNNINTRNINFGQKLPTSKIDKNIADKTLAIASAAATSVATAIIAINQDKSSRAKFDHKVLAEEIEKRVNQKMPYKQICEELGISSALYCQIVKEFNIQSQRQISRQNRANVDIQKFKKDVQEGLLTTEEILKKYNIGHYQYLGLLKDNNLKSKKMKNNEKVENISREEFIAALEGAHTQVEVCRKLGITNKTFHTLKEKFNVKVELINEHEEWDCLTKSELEAIANSGRSLKSICDEYHITPIRYQTTMSVNNIKTSNVLAVEQRRNLDLQSLQADINADIPISELLTKYGISTHQFQTLIDEGSITTPQKNSRDKVANITYKMFSEVVANSTSTKEACQKLNISKGTFYNLERKFGIEVSWKKSRAADSYPMTKDELEQAIKSNKTIDEICEENNISQYMYYQMIKFYQIKTPHIQTRELLAQFSEEQLQAQIEEKEFHKDVYNELGLTRKQYTVLLKRIGIKTTHQEQKERIAKIKKGELLTLILKGFTISDICNELDISLNTCRQLLKKHSISWNATGTTQNQNNENLNNEG
ncbi:MAG: hypothetical protein MJ237_03265 [bacterium]|nr:hypothetical protein [bacterium]